MFIPRQVKHCMQAGGKCNVDADVDAHRKKAEDRMVHSYSKEKTLQGAHLSPPLIFVKNLRNLS
jgi:hypothetical protein